MSRNVLLALAALAIPALLFALWQGLGSESSGERAASKPAGTSADATEPAEAKLQGTTADPRGRDPVAGTPAPAPSDPGEPGLAVTEPVADAAEPTLHVRGLVVDALGRPLSGVPVVRHGSSKELARSAGDGRFALEIPGGESSTELVARGNGFAALRKTIVRGAGGDREHVLVAAPAIDLVGAVRGQDGPLAGAAVSLGLDAALARRFPRPLDRTASVAYRAKCDDRGHFELSTVPALEGGSVTATHEDHESASIPLPARSRDDLVIDLARSDRGPRVTGTVLLSDGTPAHGAHVQYGFHEGLADEQGAFELELERDPDPDLPLVAGLRKRGVALIEDFGAMILAAAPHPPPPVTLVLAEEGARIGGRVVDARGEPLAGWNVAITDGLEVSRGQVPPVIVEGFGTGGARATTSKGGAFELRDLLERSYALRALDPETLLCVFTEPIPAGTMEVEIRVPDGAYHERVAGVVVSRTGLPVAGARVTPGFVTSRVEGGSSWISGTPVTTAADGGFELARVPREHVHIDVGGDLVVPRRFELDSSGSVEGLELEVARRCHFQVAVTGSSEGTRLEVHDAAGERLSIYRFQANVWSAGPTTAIQDGSTGVRAVSEDAAAIVLVRRTDAGSEELVRRAVVLVPDQMNELELAVP